MGRGPAIGVDDDLPARQAGVAVRAALHEAAGGIDVPDGLAAQEAVGEDALHQGPDGLLDPRRRRHPQADALGVLGGDDQLGHRHGPAVLIGQGDLALGVGLQEGHLARVPGGGQPAQDLVGILQGRRHQGGGLVAGVAEHDPLVAGAFVLGVGGVDALGDVAGLAMQVTGVLRLLPVEALLFVADVLDRGPHPRLQRGDHFAGEGLVLGLVGAGTGGADLSGQDDPVGGDQGLAGHAGLGIGGDEGVHHGVGDAVGDLVRMAFGNAFAGEEVGGAGHGTAPSGSRRALRRGRRLARPIKISLCPARPAADRRSRTRKDRSPHRL